MGVSEFDAISMTTDAIPRLSMAFQLRGTDAMVGFGVQMGGAIDSIGPLEKGKWALERASRARSRFSGVAGNRRSRPPQGPRRIALEIHPGMCPSAV